MAKGQERDHMQSHGPLKKKNLIQGYVIWLHNISYVNPGLNWRKKLLYNLFQSASGWIIFLVCLWGMLTSVDKWSWCFVWFFISNGAATIMLEQEYVLMSDDHGLFRLMRVVAAIVTLEICNLLLFSGFSFHNYCCTSAANYFSPHPPPSPIFNIRFFLCTPYHIDYYNF